MNIENRKKLVLAMEMLARQVNDEGLLMSWLMFGVPDEEIKEFSTDTGQVDDFFMEDQNFAELMRIFLRIMAKAYKSGGLYCDGVCSDKKER